MLKLGLIITTILAGIYVLLCFLLYFFQEKLIFPTHTLPQNYKFHFAHPFQEYTLKTSDGAALNALYFRQKGARGVILYFHGNGGTLESWGHIMEDFVNYDYPYHLFIMDYRGYGKSTGKRSQKALLDDTQVCYDFLQQELGYKESQIVIYGRSLGTGIAAYLASQNNPSKLILETPYYSMLEMAKITIPPVFPVSLLLRYPLEAHKYVQQVSCPVYMFHGTGDTTIPYREAEKLSKVNPSKTIFYTIPKGQHHDLIRYQEFRRAMKTILY